MQRALQTLSKCNEALIHATDETELLATICRIVVETGGYRLAWVGYAENDKAKSVRPVAQMGFEAGYLETLKITWADTARGRSPTGAAIRTGQPCLARNIVNDAAFAPWRKEALKRGYESSISLPLLAGGKPLGALNLYTAEPDAFDAKEVALLRELADDLAHGINTLRTRTGFNQAEKALRQSEQNYRELVEHANSIILRWTGDGRITFMNEFGLKFFGYSAAEIFGRHVVGAIVPESESTGRDLRPLIEQICAEPKAFEQNVNENLRRNGERVWIAWTNKAIMDDQGRLREVLSIGSDITARRQAEQALRNHEAFLNKLIENIPHMIFVKDAQELRFLKFNQAGEELLGYSREELVGKNDYDFFQKKEADYYTSKDREVLQSGELLDIPEEEIPTRTKGRRTLHTKKIPILDDAGHLLYLLGISEDITERKRAEDELRTVNELNREVISGASEGIIVYDRELRIRLWNRFMEQVTGLPAAEVLGQKAPDLFPHLREQGVDRLLERALKGETVDSDEVSYYMPRTGKKGWVKGCYAPHRGASGEIIGVIGMVREITEHKRAEEALRENEARLQMVLQSACMGVWHWDIIENKRYFDDQTCHLLGINPATFTGTDGEFFRVVHPGSRAAVKAALARTVESDAPYESEYCVVWPDASVHHVTSRGRLVRDPAGRPARINGILWDITERRKLEAQFLRVQRMEAIGTLAGGVAHDLNNVLAPIMMACELLKPDERDKDQPRLLEIIRVSTKRGAGLVKQILSFARGLDSQRVELQPARLIEELQHILRETFPKSIRFQTELAPNLWTLAADAIQIDQVLLNLCINARDAMPNGGTLTITAQNVTLGEDCPALNPEAKPGDYVMISIADTGTGIPAEIRAKIFSPFFTTKEAGKGTGLGLSTALGIVKNHAGFLNLHSETGKGSVFKVYLPASPPAKAADQQGGKPQSHRGNGELILVVDDEASFRAITKQTLEAWGYRVITAGNGAKAITLYAQHQQECAAVLMDMVMPVTDGLAAIQTLAQMNPQVKIIAASGFIAEGAVAKAKSKAVKKFLLKPYTPARLLKAVHEVIHESPVAR